MREGLKKLALAMAIGTVSAGVYAAQDGNLATAPTPSVGDFDIRLLINQKVKVWGFADMTFTSVSDPAKSQTICYFSNSDRVSFAVSSSNGISPGGEFTLEKDASNYLPYTVTIANADDAANTVDTWGVGSLGSGIPSPVIYPDNKTPAEPTNSTPCSSTYTQANITVALGTVVGTIDDGTYSDTVTVTVSAI